MSKTEFYTNQINQAREIAQTNKRLYFIAASNNPTTAQPYYDHYIFYTQVEQAAVAALNNTRGQ